MAQWPRTNFLPVVFQLGWKTVTEEDFKLLAQKNNVHKDDGDVNKKEISKMQREKNCCEDFIIVRVFCMINTWLGQDWGQP